MEKRVYTFVILFSVALCAFSQVRKVSLLFVGDAMQHGPQIKAAATDSGYVYDRCFQHIQQEISAADIACVNFETTLGGKPYRGYPLFSAPDEYAIALQHAGFDLFFTANNHCLDTGKKGLERTIEVLDTLGVKHTGTFVNKENRTLYYPLMIIKSGIRMAFLNYTYGTNGLSVSSPNVVNFIDPKVMKKDIEAAKRMMPDVIIANVHWGNEYQTKASAAQQEVARFLHANGVRIVIGHHPHVVEPIVVSQENDSIRSVVYYSLGNFVSNQRKTNTDGGAVALITLSQEEYGKPVKIESCDYELVWVNKFFEHKKPVYEIVPLTQSGKPTITLSAKAREKAAIFARNAARILTIDK